MSIQWITLAKIGPFSVKLAYLALCFLLALAVVNSRVINGSIALIRQNIMWVAPYGLYLLMLSMALVGSPGQGIGPRQVLYLTCGLAFAGYLAVDARPGALLRAGGAMGILLFLAAVEVMARQIGLSWTTAIGHFLATGDLNFIIYSFFRAVFNVLSPDGEVSVKAAEKNGVAVCILVAVLLFRAGHTRSRPDWLGIGITLVGLGLIVLLNTRSVLIVAVGSLLLASLLRSVTRNTTSLAGPVMKTAGFVALAVLAVLFAGSDQAVFGTMSDRFAFEDASTEHRLAQYEWAMQQIEGNLLVGQGYADALGAVIHNLFLSAWVHAGLLAFLLVVVFYAVIAAEWIVLMWRVVQRPGRWVLPLPFEWVAVLPIMPLFRVWVSGDAGHLFLGEWIALLAFFGLHLRNRLAVREHAAQGHRDGPAAALLPVATPATARFP